MARKSKKQIEEEAKFERYKATIYEASDEEMWTVNFEEDRLFAILLICGYPASKAYKAAYPMSNANQASCAVLASRRIREPEVQQLIGSMMRKFEDGYLTISTKCYKSKPYRRPRWLPPAKKKFEPID